MKSFIVEESGAVTVDWVVLTAAIVGLGLATMAVVSGGVENLSNDTAQELADAEPGSNTFASLAGGFDGSSYTSFGSAGYYSAAQSYFGSTSEGELSSSLASYDSGMAGSAGSFSGDDLDLYAGTYAAAQDRGMDVSGYTNPDDYVAVYNSANG